MTRNRPTITGWVLTVTLSLTAAAAQWGCGATCDRMEKDRKEFLGRKSENSGPHIEAIVPFDMANELIVPQIKKVKPIDIKMSGLGKLGDYLGELSVIPARVEMKPASKDHIGFRLTFDIRDKGKKAFEMYADIEVQPQVDLETGKVIIAFTSETLKDVKPQLSRDAKKDLGGMIYDKIPKTARIFIPRSLVDAAAGTAVKSLVTRFYEKSRDKLLPGLADMSRFEFQLPQVPIESITITSSGESGGSVRFMVVTKLPVRKGITPPPVGPKVFPRDRISIRMSGSTMAELVNWAMAKKLVPDRYDSKGKAKENGELRPGLDWKAGDKRPMKIYLWDLDKPCMRITLTAKPSVEIVEGQLQIKATDTKTEDVEASAFTKVGVWFYVLWKDAIKFKKKASSQMEFSVAGQEMVASVEETSIANDELSLSLSLKLVGK